MTDMIDLTPIFQAVIMLLAALVTYKLIPWIKERTSEQQRENISAAVRVLVFAAEQIYGAGRGKEKLEYVCAELEKRGYEVDLADIEATVYSAFNYMIPLAGGTSSGATEEKDDEDGVIAEMYPDKVTE